MSIMARELTEGQTLFLRASDGADLTTLEALRLMIWIYEPGETAIAATTEQWTAVRSAIRKAAS